jgi:hypothetical protein
VGYSYQAVKIMSYEGEAFREEYVEHVPPDPGAAKMWLCNRRSDEWREKVEHTGSGGGPIQIEWLAPAA